MELSDIFVKTPCDLYKHAGSSLFPYDVLEVFSKVVFQIRSIKTLTDLATMQQLCEIDNTVKRLLKTTNTLEKVKISMKYPFNIPYYAMCYEDTTEPHNCSSLSQQQLNLLVDDLIPCLNDITRANCTSKYSRQLSILIIGTKNKTIGTNEPVYVSVILPLTASEDLQEFYEALLGELQQQYQTEKLKFVGAFFGIKAPVFAKLILTDIAYGFLSIALVIMGIQFFPFLNLLAIVMIIAVGADDVFLFMYQLDKYLRETSSVSTDILTVDEDDDLKKEGSDELQVIKDVNSAEEILKEKEKEKLRQGLDAVMSHAAIAMLVTSATTAFAFYTNINSNILVLRCFGLYAGTTMILNYIFVITVLPAAIVVFKPKMRLKNRRLFCAKLRQTCCRCFSVVYNQILKIFIVWIPQIVRRIRFIIIPLSLGLFALCVYAVAHNPGIRLPQTNPLQVYKKLMIFLDFSKFTNKPIVVYLQLLRSSHPFEWYDEYSSEIFEYSEHSNRKMNFVFVWGVNPTKYVAICTASTMDPHSLGTLSVDNKFPVFFAKNLQAFADLLRYIVENYGDGDIDTDSLWINEFLEYVSDSNDCNPPLFNSNTTEINLEQLKNCILSFGHNRFMGTPYSDSLLETVDGPIYNSNGDFIGYMLVTQSKFKWSMIFHKMELFFKHLQQVENAIANFTSEISGIPLVTGPVKETLLYDLLQSLPTSTTVSVLISFFLGWVVNVVEATIIVLTIGMSFDYTLHFAVAFKMHGSENPSTLTSIYRTVYSLVSVAVLLAAVSTFVAGLGLMGAQTQPFFEIGTFLMIVTSTSLIVSLFVFPAYVITFLKPKLKTTKL
uniref:SSD domain-containing protein n=1 Tax=Syphacia muris TaxID=451379 RepID=A0A0N5AAH0_9BILA